MNTEVIIGIITVFGVIINATFTLLSNNHKSSSEQTIETMKIQKTLIDTLFEENKVLSKRIDSIENSLKEERKEFQEELTKTREEYTQLKRIVEEAVSLLRSDKYLEALKLLEK